MIFIFSDMLASLTALMLLLAYAFVITFTVWMIVDAAKHDKFWWLFLTISLPFIGAVMYYCTEKKKLYEKLAK